MAIKSPSKKATRQRLVVYVSPLQFGAIQKEVARVGFKNAHAWAASKLAFAIADVCHK